MSKLLIADDDLDLGRLLKDYLQQEGFEIDLVENGDQAINKILENKYDLLILDVMMPGKNGFETLAEIRRNSQLPVIMLTARGEKVDRIVGLEMGADDYVGKPADPRELVARIRAIIRRSHTKSDEPESSETVKLSINGVEIDPLNRQVYCQGDEVELTSTEFELLKLLMENAGQLVKRETISEQCLGKKLQPFDRSIDMHLSNVRKKLGDFAQDKPRVKTVRGSGYQYLIWDAN
ncbi:response regulator [Aliikangiella sp. G2MR2-5]|uniref:response regulator n=1 Tax=Aliikangiella sp. G2MR2-5 TaxID=2788943 RepID=UPI0018AAFCEF|nr:response regulator [Aliikangiella sp. G2MR2-5]